MHSLATQGDNDSCRVVARGQHFAKATPLPASYQFTVRHRPWHTCRYCYQLFSVIVPVSLLRWYLHSGSLVTGGCNAIFFILQLSLLEQEEVKNFI